MKPYKENLGNELSILIIYLSNSKLCETSAIYTSSVNGFIVKYLNETLSL